MGEVDLRVSPSLACPVNICSNPSRPPASFISYTECLYHLSSSLAPSLTQLQSSWFQPSQGHLAKHGCSHSYSHCQHSLSSSLMNVFLGELKPEQYIKVSHRLSLSPKQSSLHITYLDINVFYEYFISSMRKPTTFPLQKSLCCLVRLPLSFLGSLEPAPVSFCLQHPGESLFIMSEVTGQVSPLKSHPSAWPHLPRVLRSPRGFRGATPSFFSGLTGRSAPGWFPLPP